MCWIGLGSGQAESGCGGVWALSAWSQGLDNGPVPTGHGRCSVSAVIQSGGGSQTARIASFGRNAKLGIWDDPGPGQAPAEELAALYHERWEIETTYDEIKTHLLGPGAILRSKTPELVYQEIGGLMLAHYAVRRLIHEAAGTAREDPDRLSFLHATRVMRRRIVQPGGFPPEHQTDHLIREILEERTVSSRGQKKPRGVKRKMSNYPLRKRGSLSRKI